MAPGGSPTQLTLPSRRALLRAGAFALLGAALGPRLARAGEGGRRLRMIHAHTGERLDVVYAEGGALLPDALAALDTLLRDHRTGDVHAISTATLDIVWALAQAVERPVGTFEIVCGYRTPRTNELLREHGSGGVARRSLHLDGRALDLRLPGVPTARLRDAARTLARGGVGYYRSSDFVHVDDGRVRTW